MYISGIQNEDGTAIRQQLLGYAPLGLSSSMVTIVAGGPGRDSLHSAHTQGENEITLKIWISDWRMVPVVDDASWQLMKVIFGFKIWELLTDELKYVDIYKRCLYCIYRPIFCLYSTVALNPASDGGHSELFLSAVTWCCITCNLLDFLPFDNIILISERS